MLLPTLDCPAHCGYCFGPHEGSPTMGAATLDAVVRWQQALGEHAPLEITFHGGEPLLAGAAFYRAALPVLRDGLAPREVHFSVQSNLWLLDDDLCELFREYRVLLGTSLDGPEEINDAQRGAGCFRSTMDGIQRARTHGLGVGCICTFTGPSARRADEVFDFFLEQRLGFSIHAALPPFGRAGLPWTLSPQETGPLLLKLLERYLPNLDRLRISTLDAMTRSIGAGEGAICTFGDCLGKFLAVDPQGWIYACQRFAGLLRFRLGNVHEMPSWEGLRAAPAWRMLQQRQDRISEECAACAHLDICRGGCPYNVLAANSGRFDGIMRDPYCPAYKRTFDAITERAMAEVFSEVNLTAVVERRPNRHGLLQKGRILQLMRGGPHPRDVAAQSRRVIAAVALAGSASLDEAAARLERAGAVTNWNLAHRSLASLHAQLHGSTTELLNAYIHVTTTCNLACDHCYAAVGEARAEQAMPVEDVASFARSAAEAGFRKAVITGGEPLTHPQRDALLKALTGLRGALRPLKIVLRTNLAGVLPPDLHERLCCSVDQIVVSVDGDEVAHDARRGPGTYARTVANLRELVEPKDCTDLVIAATLSASHVAGREGEAVRRLAEELGVGVRFKPVLPLGRAAGMPLAPEFYSSLDDDAEDNVFRAQLTATCGLGMNLSIGPDGECFPCYALAGPKHALGNILVDGMDAVLARNDAYRQVTVDSNRGCRECALRYLCGGLCRAWGRSDDADTPPVDCTGLRQRAWGLLAAAQEALGMQKASWLAAGLPSQDQV